MRTMLAFGYCQFSFEFNYKHLRTKLTEAAIIKKAVILIKHRDLTVVDAGLDFNFLLIGDIER